MLHRRPIAHPSQGPVPSCTSFGVLRKPTEFPAFARTPFAGRDQQPAVIGKHLPASNFQTISNPGGLAKPWPARRFAAASFGESVDGVISAPSIGMRRAERDLPLPQVPKFAD